MSITSFLQVKDGASSTLNGAISDSALTIVLADGSVFPTTGNTFIISIDSEDILIDSRSTNTLTVNASGRGYNGTVAAAHLTAATVSLFVIAKHVQDLDTAVNGLENASFPGITVAQGGILHRASSGNGALSALAIGSANKVLTTNGTVPSWTSIVEANITAGTITNTSISASAAIGLSKLATGALPAAITSAYANITNFDKTRVTRGSTQLISNATSTAMSWSSADFQVNQTTSWVIGDPTKVYARTTGKFLICAFASFASNATGYRQFSIKINGTATSYVTIPAVNGDESGQSLSTVISLTSGDYVELFVYQTSTGNLNVAAGAHLEISLLP